MIKVIGKVLIILCFLFLLLSDSFFHRRFDTGYYSNDSSYQNILFDYQEGDMMNLGTGRISNAMTVNSGNQILYLPDSISNYEYEKDGKHEKIASLGNLLPVKYYRTKKDVLTMAKKDTDFFVQTTDTAQNKPNYLLSHFFVDENRKSSLYTPTIYVQVSERFSRIYSITHIVLIIVFWCHTRFVYVVYLFVHIVSTSF